MVAGAAGNLAGQVAGKALGIQEDINWGSVATSAITGAITQYTGLNASLANAPMGKVVQHAVTRNMVSQGVNILTGQQEQFSWQSMAASAIAAPLTHMIDKQFSTGDYSKEAKLGGVDRFGQHLGSELSKAAVNQAVHMVVNNQGKMDWRQVAIDGFGNALGNSIVENLKIHDAQKQQDEEREQQREINKAEALNAASQRVAQVIGQKTASGLYADKSYTDENGLRYGPTRVKAALGLDIAGVPYERRDPVTGFSQAEKEEWINYYQSRDDGQYINDDWTANGKQINGYSIFLNTPQSYVEVAQCIAGCHGIERDLTNTEFVTGPGDHFGASYVKPFVEYLAQKQVETGNPLYSVVGVPSTLLLPENQALTEILLGGAKAIPSLIKGATGLVSRLGRSGVSDKTPLSYDISKWGEYGLPSDGTFVRTLTPKQYRDLKAGRNFDFAGSRQPDYGYPQGMGFIGSAEEARHIDTMSGYREALKLDYDPKYVMEFQLKDPSNLQNVLDAPWDEFIRGGKTGAGFSEWNYPGINSGDIINPTVRILK